MNIQGIMLKYPVYFIQYDFISICFINIYAVLLCAFKTLGAKARRPKKNNA